MSCRRKPLLSRRANHSRSITLLKATITSAVWIRIASPRVAKDCSGCIESIVLLAVSEKRRYTAGSELKKNNVVWTHRNKCNGTISWHNIAQ
ncbi:hypothetical protein AHAS_Ahas07G0172900 [Arachis hypogaea]